MRSFLLWNPLFAFVVLATATVACGDLAEQPANPESEESSFTVDEYTSSSQMLSEFMSELQAGASCEELFAKRLFAKRNSAPSDPIRIDQMNIELSFIGCLSRWSERRDLAEQPANPESEESSFTVDEYRLYRSVIDTPLSVSGTYKLFQLRISHFLGPATTSVTTPVLPGICHISVIVALNHSIPPL